MDGYQNPAALRFDNAGHAALCAIVLHPQGQSPTIVQLANLAVKAEPGSVMTSGNTIYQEFAQTAPRDWNTWNSEVASQGEGGLGMAVELYAQSEQLHALEASFAKAMPAIQRELPPDVARAASSVYQQVRQMVAHVDSYKPTATNGARGDIVDWAAANDPTLKAIAGQLGASVTAQDDASTLAQSGNVALQAPDRTTFASMLVAFNQSVDDFNAQLKALGVHFQPIPHAETRAAISSILGSLQQMQTHFSQTQDHLQTWQGQRLRVVDVQARKSVVPTIVQDAASRVASEQAAASMGS
jgi:hypothetical protein